MGSIIYGWHNDGAPLNWQSWVIDSWRPLALHVNAGTLRWPNRTCRHNNPAERSLRHLISRKDQRGHPVGTGTESKMTNLAARGLNPLAACRQLFRQI